MIVSKWLTHLFLGRVLCLQFVIGFFKCQLNKKATDVITRADLCKYVLKCNLLCERELVLKDEDNTILLFIWGDNRNHFTLSRSQIKQEQILPRTAQQLQLTLVLKVLWIILKHVKLDLQMKTCFICGLQKKCREPWHSAPFTSNNIRCFYSSCYWKKTENVILIPLHI